MNFLIVTIFRRMAMFESAGHGSVAAASQNFTKIVLPLRLKYLSFQGHLKTINYDTL